MAAQKMGDLELRGSLFVLNSEAGPRAVQLGAGRGHRPLCAAGNCARLRLPLRQKPRVAASTALHTLGQLLRRAQRVCAEPRRGPHPVPPRLQLPPRPDPQRRAYALRGAARPNLAGHACLAPGQNPGHAPAGHLPRPGSPATGPQPHGAGASWTRTPACCKIRCARS